METLTTLVFSIRTDDGSRVEALLPSGAGAPVRVIVAGSAAEAADLLDSVKVDAVLLELELPAAPSLELLRTFRGKVPQLPLIVIAPSDEAGQQALEEGAQEYLARAEVTGALLARSLRHAAERMRARAALRLSEERFRTMADFTADWEYWTGPDRRLIYMSPSCQRITGYAAEEFRDDPGLLERVVHPDDRDAFARHRVEVYGESGGPDPQELEFRIVRRDGVVRWIGHVCQSVVGRAGRPLGRRISNRDITARKEAQAQLQRLNAELERRVAERTADLALVNRELESFSYSVSHDLRAPLRTIDGFSRMLVEEIAGQLEESAAGHLRRITDAAHRMTELIDDLLRLSRVMRLEFSPVPVDLTALVGRIVEELRSEHPQRAVEVVIAPDLAAVGDRSMLTIALRNLLDNAWKYTGRTRGARIEFGARDEGGRRIFFVRDNGAGFDMAYADRLFQPFQRLHGVEEFPGTGVGLATVARIVHRHHGEIVAEARPGEGATFSFTLEPAVEGGA